MRTISTLVIAASALLIGTSCDFEEPPGDAPSASPAQAPDAKPTPSAQASKPAPPASMPKAGSQPGPAAPSPSARAKVDLLAIEMAIDLFKMENNGKLPANLAVLVAPDANGQTYIKGATSVPLDPWGHEYFYIAQPNGAYDLGTYGADGHPGGDGANADITMKSIRNEVSNRAPARVKVAHVLIAFKGAERSTATRSKEEAEKLANEIFERAKKGEDFDLLMKQSNDPGGGKYGMYTTTQSMKPGDFPKSGMAKGFAELGFSLPVGEVGMCPYDPVKSPFGWHIIKRIE